MTAFSSTLVNSAILRLSPSGNRLIGTTQQDIRLNADGAQFLDRVLRRFGLDLSGCLDERHQGEVHEQGIVVPEFHAHLPDRFQEGQRLDITHRAANLDQCDIGISGTLMDRPLDLVGDVRNHLHRSAQIVAATLLANHVLVDLTRSEVVAAGHPDANETLVVPQIEVGLRPIGCDEHLTMLKRAHRTRIHIDIGIQLEQRHFEAAGLQDRSQRCGCDSLCPETKPRLR